MVRSLDLPWGYRAERSISAMRLVDPIGRLVTQFVNPLTFGDLAETEPRGRLEDSAISVEGWKGLCRILLIRLFDQAVESTQLREQLRDLGARLERVEEERDQANAVSEDLYAFFREHMREVAENKSANENLPATLVEQADHRNDLDKGDVTHEEE
ncbi:MAG: hypothetical protein ACR2JR_15200 [Rubrobacteraceae bacterium]